MFSGEEVRVGVGGLGRTKQARWGGGLLQTWDCRGVGGLAGQAALAMAGEAALAAGCPHPGRGRM